MTFNERDLDECRVDYTAECDYFSSCPQQLFWSNATCPAEDMFDQSYQPEKTLRKVVHIFWTIVPILFFLALARVVAHKWSRTRTSDSVLRFMVEFVIIMLPSILSVNVANAYVEKFVLVMGVALVVLIWRTRCLQKAKAREFKLGRRPKMLTLVRAAVNLLTSVCILAIDFNSFPIFFRKTRAYGAGLMDVGIGLFVFAMGTVSRRPRSPADISRLMRVVAPVLFLGLARTVVIMIIDYHQDEHEYGMHLNAFFTLGFTKLFGTLLSAVATQDKQLLPLGIGVLVLHECTLQLGLSKFVMDNSVERTTMWTANREGLFSLPGFVGIYLIAMYIGQWLQCEEPLNFREYLQKLKSLLIATSLTWLGMLISNYVVGIARVTCNFGYAMWVFCLVFSMVTLFLFTFEFVLNTLWPTYGHQLVNNCQEGDLLLKNDGNIDSQRFQIPTLVEAVNRNGLLFFLVSNFLTGGVNIFLHPDDRTDFESIIILLLYMLTATGFVYVLYRLRIRIA